jgi:hypothetical protein
MEFDDITLGEIEEIEDFAGLSISQIGEDKPGVIKLRIGLAWIIKRRSNPNYTVEDARKMSAKELTAFFEEQPEKKE